VRGRVRTLAGEVPDLRLVVLDGRTTPSIDVTAVDMLVQLRTDLSRLGAELVMAGDVGQVRDVLASAGPAGEPPLHPTIEAALGAPDVPPARSPGSGEAPRDAGAVE